jgi:flagellar biosynthesis protein FliQ
MNLISWPKRIVLKLIRTFFNLTLRICSVILLTVMASGLVVLLFLYNHSISLSLLKIIVILGLGLMAGLAARWLLHRNTLLLTLLTAWLSLIFGLGLLDILSGGFIGMGLVRNDDPTSGILSILISFITAWLAVRGWRKPVRVKQTTASLAATAQPALPPAKIPHRLPASQAKIRNKPAKKIAPAPKHAPVFLPHTTKKGTPQMRSGESKKHLATALIHEEVKISQKTKADHFRRRTLSRKFHKRAVQLVGTEEHRCPYCLELVEPNDPRGVVVCPICHTRHHADCWNVTGVCQVPHKNAL